MTHLFLLTCFASLLLVEFFALIIWMAAYRIQKTSIVDIFWSLLVFCPALVYWIVFASHDRVSCLYLFLFCLWALRLAFHIYARSRGHSEDPRYRALREKWGVLEKKKMLKFYFQQGAAAWFLALPFLIIFSNPARGLNLWDGVGIVIWMIAFAGEMLSDLQLAGFKKNPMNSGKVCRIGFWRYSRHPNYFFEWLNWVAWAWMALPYQFGLFAIVCPVLMYYVLNHVSGVPLAEKQSLKSRSIEYQEYQRVTAPFFPWIPKVSEILK